MDGRDAARIPRKQDESGCAMTVVLYYFSFLFHVVPWLPAVRAASEPWRASRPANLAASHYIDAHARPGIVKMLLVEIGRPCSIRLEGLTRLGNELGGMSSFYSGCAAHA